MAEYVHSPGRMGPIQIRFKGIDVQRNDIYSPGKSNQLKKAFRNYIVAGGPP